MEFSVNKTFSNLRHHVFPGGTEVTVTPAKDLKPGCEI